LYYTKLNISEDRDNPKHIICYKDLPLYYPNQFLDTKGINSAETRTAYAKDLVRFFNYLEDIYDITDYRVIHNDNILNDFMKSIIYDFVIDSSGNKRFLYENKTMITPNTANTYMSRIQNFYLQLEKPLLGLIEFDSDYLEKMLTNKQKRRIRQRTSYKGIWGILDLTELDLHANTKWKDKSKKKKSFTSDEVNWLVANLRNKSLRDECIFLTCLETGARITEVLTSLKKSFKQNSNGVWTLAITESKTQPRYVAVQPYLAKKINQYINTERRRVTNNSSEYENLFVAAKGVTKGLRLSYGAFRVNLKEAGEKAGMDATTIMSHLARGTKATQMVIEGKTKEEARIALGNKITINPYIDYGNPELVRYTGKALYYIDEE